MCIYIYIYICPPGFHPNGFVATLALGYMMYVRHYTHIAGGNEPKSAQQAKEGAKYKCS